MLADICEAIVEKRLLLKDNIVLNCPNTPRHNDDYLQEEGLCNLCFQII